MLALLCNEFGPIQNLAVKELPTPQPTRGQMLVKVEAASINFPDALMVQGLYQFKPPTPFIPGAELAGVVEAVGEGVEQFKVGDRIFGSTSTGAFAQYCVVDQNKAMKIPQGMPAEAAASLMLAYGTSLHALQTVAKIKPNETLLVLGAAGGVGIAAIELAKAFGANVIAAASSAEKLALAKKAGADHGINYTQDNWRKDVEALTAGKGVDVVYDAVGGSYSETALRATAWRGRYLVVGFAAGDIPKLPLNLMLLKERIVMGVFWGSAMAQNPEQLIADTQQLSRLYKEGKISPPVTERVSLTEAADAMIRLSTRQAMGKIVILPNP